MAFTREFIRSRAKESGIDIPKELEDALISEHISARDAHGENEAKKARETAAANAPKVEDTEEYKNLKRQFEDYRADVDAKAAGAAKEAAYRALLTEAGVDPKRIDTVIRAEKSGFGELKIGEDGKFEGADKLTEAIRTNWADFIQTTVTTGVPVAKPPVNNGGSTMTKKEIDAIKDPVERQSAIAANIELYRKG